MLGKVRCVWSGHVMLSSDQDRSGLVRVGQAADLLCAEAATAYLEHLLFYSLPCCAAAPLRCILRNFVLRQAAACVLASHGCTERHLSRLCWTDDCIHFEFPVKHLKRSSVYSS